MHQNVMTNKLFDWADTNRRSNDALGLGECGRLPKKKLLATSSLKILPHTTTPPEKYKPPYRRFLIKINWHGEVLEYWRQTPIKNTAKAKKTVLCYALVELSKKVDHTMEYVYLHACDPNFQRWEVNEQ